MRLVKQHDTSRRLVLNKLSNRRGPAMEDASSDDDIPGGTQSVTQSVTPLQPDRKRPRRDLEFRGCISRPVAVEQDRARICCNIHGSVYAEPLIKQLMDTDEIQRLRRLKQLGTAQHIYPDAQHTRFNHSLGVMHLGEVLCKRVRERPMPTGVERPSDRDILCVKIAGLCHDLGHGPFSHVFDGKVVPAAAVRAFEEGRDELARKLEVYTHEDMSIKMMERMFTKAKINLDDWDANGERATGDDDDEAERLSHAEDFRFIQELILGADLEGGVRSRIGRGPSKWYLYDVISNVDSGLDVDKLDYMLRDMKDAIGIHTGLKPTDEQTIHSALCSCCMHPPTCPLFAPPRGKARKAWPSTRSCRMRPFAMRASRSAVAAGHRASSRTTSSWRCDR